MLQEHAETEGTFAAIKADLYLSEELVIALLLCAQHSSHSYALTDLVRPSFKNSTDK